VSDSDCLTADQNFLDDQPNDFLPLDHIQCLGSGAKSPTKLGKCFGKSQVCGLILRRYLERVQLRFESLLLLAQTRYALPQLGQRDQFFLIGGHKARHMVFQPRVLLPEALFSFSERIGLTRRLHPAIDLTLDQRRVVQQPDNFFPHKFIQVVLANGPVATYRSL